MKGVGLFFFLLFIFLILGLIGWVVFTQVRARRAGLEPPSWRSYIPFVKSNSSTNYPTPRTSNPLEWIKDQLAKLSNRRTARGAYEETGSGNDNAYGGASRGGARRGRGLEDDAWDTRVGNEDPYGPGPGAFYEEQELGLAPTPGLHPEPYGGVGAGAGDYMTAGGSDAQRGRSKNRAHNQSLDPNPFDDQHEAPSLRAVSPRPEAYDPSKGHVHGAPSLDATQKNLHSGAGSTRQSMFREGL